MKQRGLVQIFGMVAVGLIVGCGSSSDTALQDDTASAPDFDGTYRPTSGGGDIASITFNPGQGYMLLPTGCAAASCADVGSYTLDPARTLLTLNNAITGKQRVIDVRVLKTTQGDSLLGTRDLTNPTQIEDPSGQQIQDPNGKQVQGKQQKVSGNQQQVSGNASQLLSTIASAAMNGVQMAQGANAANAANDPNNNNNNAANDANNAALHLACSTPKAAGGLMPTGADVTDDQMKTYFATCAAGPDTGIQTV